MISKFTKFTHDFIMREKTIDPICYRQSSSSVVMSDREENVPTSEGEKDDTRAVKDNEQESRNGEEADDTKDGKKVQKGKKKAKKRTESMRGMYVARAIRSKLRDRLERERMVGVSVSSSSSDTDCEQGENGSDLVFEELNSSLLRQVVDIVEEEERNVRENGRGLTHSQSSISSSSSGMSSDLEVEKEIINMLDQEKVYSTPYQIDEEIVRQVVRRTESASERSLRWGANELGGLGTLKKIWLSMKNSERLRGVKREADESINSD